MPEKACRKVLTQAFVTCVCYRGGPSEDLQFPLMFPEYGHNACVINKPFAYDELGHLVNVLGIQIPEENNNN